MSDDADALGREAAVLLDQALNDTLGLHRPGARNRYRRQLARVIAKAEATLASGLAAPETVSGTLGTLISAHAARAEDARHGAGQLSRGAQRAPTRDACKDGWQRVEAIVRGAEASASEANRAARALDAPAAWDEARRAKVAAQAARRIVEERNDAYTFHTDPGFSFGEGWYLAAAAVLSDVTIQIEPDKPQTHQAERFLRDAGLSRRLTPFRSRPRANKQLPEIVARAFLADAGGAQRRLRAALLGRAEAPQAIIDWADRALANATSAKKVLIWNRRGAYAAERNTNDAELVQLVRGCIATGLVPVLIGDGLPEDWVPPGATNLTLFWKDPLFQGSDMRRAQLHFFEHLRRAHALIGQIGVTTAGMDGPALMGLPTLYLTDAPNPRLGTWVGAVPGYRELVRREGYLETCSHTMAEWARSPGLPDVSPGP